MTVPSNVIRAAAIAIILAAPLVASLPSAAHPAFGGVHGGQGFGGMRTTHGFGGTHAVRGLGAMHTTHANWGGRMGGWGHHWRGGWGHGNWNKNVNRNININRNFNRNVNINRNWNWSRNGHWWREHWGHGRHGFHRWRDGFGRWHWGDVGIGVEVPLGAYGDGYGGVYADDSYDGDDDSYDGDDDYSDLPYAGENDDGASESDYVADDDHSNGEYGGNCPCACDRDNTYGDGEDGCY